MKNAEVREEWNSAQRLGALIFEKLEIKVDPESCFLNTLLRTPFQRPGRKLQLRLSRARINIKIETKVIMQHRREAQLSLQIFSSGDRNFRVKRKKK